MSEVASITMTGETTIACVRFTSGAVHCRRCGRLLKSNRGWASHRRACDKRWGDWLAWCLRGRA